MRLLGLQKKNTTGIHHRHEWFMNGPWIDNPLLDAQLQDVAGFLMPIQAYKDLRGLHDWRTRTRWCGRPCGSGPQGLEPYLPLWPVGFGGHFIQVMPLRHRNAGLRVVKMCFKELRRLMPSSMDWFKGKFTGKPHIKNGKIYGFRLRFSQQNQSIAITSLASKSRLTSFAVRQWQKSRKPIDLHVMVKYHEVKGFAARAHPSIRVQKKIETKNSTIF